MGGGGRGGQPNRSAWPFHPSFFLMTSLKTSLKIGGWLRVKLNTDYKITQDTPVRSNFCEKFLSVKKFTLELLLNNASNKYEVLDQMSDPLTETVDYKSDFKKHYVSSERVTKGSARDGRQLKRASTHCSPPPQLRRCQQSDLGLSPACG